MSFGGDVHVAPGSGTASVDDLLRAMGRGFLIIGGTAQASPALSGGFLRAPLVVEVQQGKPVRRLRNMRFAFTTKGALGQGLVALGDARTSGAAMAVTRKGMPWQTMAHPVTAPAAFCKAMDVLRMDISA
jgi:predicted Zn-dependent protease